MPSAIRLSIEIPIVLTTHLRTRAGVNPIAAWDTDVCDDSLISYLALQLADALQASYLDAVQPKRKLAKIPLLLR
ncbi:hypothetical protein [Hydrocarboniphaga sp.]|uniref:hypothetical protein n=1 Tax=Hydrocarboniphaga sp. TaxID=2033016 RepID=UPI003D0FC3CC